MFARTLSPYARQYLHKGTTAKAHHWFTRVLHWLTGGVLIYGIVRNAEVTGALFDDKAMAGEVVFSTMLGTLFIIQFFWIRFFGGGSRLPGNAPGWEHMASRAAHSAIYALVAFMIVTGLMIAYFAPGKVVFVAGERPATNDPFLVGLLAAHIRGSQLLMLLIVVHIAGALWHWVVRKDGVWEAMVGRSATFRADGK